ncbi:hypothetical protein [Pseudonocardia xishanensis]|uniref:Uncharacterized protein n=1 Tax=Pseudonocardia xishanensis TaxID=630995 RepID=A0ABP8RXQ7_9PSEU
MLAANDRAASALLNTLRRNGIDVAAGAGALGVGAVSAAAARRDDPAREQAETVPTPEPAVRGSTGPPLGHNGSG